MCLKKDDFNGYELSRNWFDFCFENPEKVNPSHTALYFFIIEHCNRLGWKEKFGLPTQMAMDAIGIKNWRTYSKSFKDLASFGFINVIESSKNQYSATVIALVKNTKANTKALTKAMQKHVQKQGNGIAVIDKPFNQEPLTIEQEADFLEENPLSENVPENPLKNENFLIPSMHKIFIEENPKYFADVSKDYEPLLKISGYIAKIYKLPENILSQTESDKKEICRRWGDLVNFISSEEWFKNYSLMQVEKHFQSIISKQKNEHKSFSQSAKQQAASNFINSARDEYLAARGETLY